MKPPTPFRPMLVVIIAVLLVASACGDDSTDSVATDAATTTDVTVADSTTTTPTTAVVSDDETAESGSAPAGAAAVDLGLFFDGALEGEATTTDCTLSGGTKTSCYEITVVGYPTDTEVGPFCPRTTADTADEVGIWLDGEALYDVDGQFILDLPEIYGDEEWHMHDDEGNVHYTDTPEAFEAAARPDVDPEYQNHCVEGSIEWLDGGEPIPTTVEIPTTPAPADEATSVGNTLGVTLNGVVIAGEAPVDAILGAYTIAAFDDCGGHINPFDGYHLHGATGCSESDEVATGDTPAFAYALDGYAIHSPLDDSQLASADLDECNGHTTDDVGYHYHAGQPEGNAVLTCFTGETTATAGQDPAAGPGPRPGG